MQNRYALMTLLCSVLTVIPVKAQPLSEVTRGVLNQHKLQAHQTMAQRYSQFAELFNWCQQKPSDEVCGDDYQQKQSSYMQSKARLDVLEMLLEHGYQELPLTSAAYPEHAKALNKLGYVETAAPEDLRVSELVEATSRWAQEQGLEPVTQLYMWHWVSLQIAADAQ